MSTRLASRPRVRPSSAPSSRPAAAPVVAPERFALGATPAPESGGVVFRVWAPFADAVAVVGDFNAWAGDAHPLARDEHGVWSVWVREASAGQEYRYELRRGADTFTRIDPRALKVTNSIGNGVVWAPPPLAAAERDFVPPTLDRLVVYELHIGTFRTTPEKGPGTFASAIEQLPYLRDLGINAVEVMPIAEFAGDFSWGYNPAHPWAVESRYGGPEGFRAFVAAAHAHGIAVILDVVYNHFGPGDLGLWRFDGWSEHERGGIYFYNDERARTPWGETRPDYGRGEVRAYLRDNAVMWREIYGVDGLRWDATVYIRTKDGAESEDIPDGWSLCQWINDELRRVRPGFITLAEDLRTNSWVVKDTASGGAGFSGQWCVGFAQGVHAALTVVRDEERQLDPLIGHLARRFEGDAFRRVVYSESHDEVANGKSRLPSEIDRAYPDSYPARKRSILGAVLTLTAPGVPMLFQGQEFLETDWFRDEVPLDWDKLAKHGGIHAAYRDLVHLRTDARDCTAGLAGQHIEINHVHHETKVLGYRRWRDGGPGDDVIVILNLSASTRENHDIGVPAAGEWHTRFNSDARAYSGDFNDEGLAAGVARAEPLDGYSHRLTVSLAPYSALILSQNRS